MEIDLLSLVEPLKVAESSNSEECKAYRGRLCVENGPQHAFGLFFSRHYLILSDMRNLVIFYTRKEFTSLKQAHIT